jgi:hypothetical protein
MRCILTPLNRWPVLVCHYISKNLFPKPSGKGKDALVERFECDLQLLSNRANQINQLMASQIEIGIQDGSIRNDIKRPTSNCAFALGSMTGGLIQTSAANEQMFSVAYGINQHDIINQGLAIAKEGLKEYGSTSINMPLLCRLLFILCAELLASCATTSSNVHSQCWRKHERGLRKNTGRNQSGSK